MADEPQAAGEQREAARHLVQNPLVAKEHDPDRFRLIRRHESELDRWFTQRLGYRLHVDGDTARLYKTGYAPDHRPLRTSTGRPFHRREYVLLALVLAATAAGPDVISLRDLVDQVRSAAAETGIVLSDERTDRRTLVSVLTWLVDHGLAVELHAHVDAYASDGEADAVLKLRPDRIVLLALPALAGATDAATLLAQAERRSGTRQWMRARLVEDPVLYRTDLTDTEWVELRRRLGDEATFLDEMFGLRLEARAEGVAAIDPGGSLTEVRFPTSGTVGHAALLLLGALVARTDRAGADAPVDRASAHGDTTDGARAGPDPTDPGDVVGVDRVRAALGSLIDAHASHWSQALVATPDRLLAEVLDVLVRLRLVALVGRDDTGIEPGNGHDPSNAVDPRDAVEQAAAPNDSDEDDSDEDDVVSRREARSVDDAGVRAIAAAISRGRIDGVQLLPAAGRFVAEEASSSSGTIMAPDEDDSQASLW